MSLIEAAAGPLSRLLSYAPIRFALVGCINTGTTLAIIFVLRFAAGWSDLAANAVGYAVGIAISFLLNRRFTFANDGPVLPALLGFGAAVAISYVANLAALFALLAAAIYPGLAHLLAMVAYTLCFYLLARMLAFRDRNSGGHGQRVPPDRDRRQR